ncbi:MAG TPA: DUF3857 domain-containing protein [Mucilaginibacter sp.]|nr:DUF3857 domain-containing protein [Mucilaginibacter sp.]
MKPLLIAACLFFIFLDSRAQNIYDASLIPKELTPYASAVVRDAETTIEVKDMDNVIYHVKKAITVLNHNGDDLARIVIFYNKNITIRSVKGVGYNEYGKPIVKFGEHDFLDESAVGEENLFGDERVKHFIPSITQYPYTIEYEYELRDRQSLTFKPWEPNSNDPWRPDLKYGLAVQNSSFNFICDPDFNIRYKEANVPEKVICSTNHEGKKVYTWQVKNLKALRYEPFSPFIAANEISVRIAPEKFSYYGINGSFNNWQQLGKWEYDKLIKDQETVPPATVQYVKELTAGISDPKLKAKKIYEYMQQKTHYISVQVGIGGFRPFPASEVDLNGYGDCKALVNYTKTLLAAVGIDSYYCVVEAGSPKVSLQHDFASMDQGDHIILCLPLKNDTTWMECTSQRIPFGFLGDFTDDRLVLACTPEGGKLLHTPKYTIDNNLEKRTANFTISESGELDGKMETVFRGVDYEDRESEIGDSRAEQEKGVKKTYPINNMVVKKLVYKQDKGSSPVTTEDISLSAGEYGALVNGKFYFSINSVDRRISVPPRVRNRVNPVRINRGYTDEDEITYTIPKGYHLSSDLLDVKLDKPFGNYTATMTLNGDQLVYKRKFQIRDGMYNKDVYDDMIDFFQAIADADTYNVALVKN